MQHTLQGIDPRNLAVAINPPSGMASVNIRPRALVGSGMLLLMLTHHIVWAASVDTVGEVGEGVGYLKGRRSQESEHDHAMRPAHISVRAKARSSSSRGRQAVHAGQASTDNLRHGCTDGQDCSVPLKNWSLNDAANPYPIFRDLVIEDKVLDGYGLGTADLDNDGKADVIVHGLNIGNTVWYKNPGSGPEGWIKHNISLLDTPVQSDFYDVDGDGWLDIGVGHNYGHGCAFNCSAKDGTASWLRNPGPDVANTDKNWTVYKMGDIMAPHRNHFGQFTRPAEDGVQFMVIPIVGMPPGFKGVHKPIALTMYDAPANPRNATSWTATLVNNKNFSLVHGAVVVNDWPGATYDTLLTGGEEGVFATYYVPTTKTWKIEKLGIGLEPKCPEGGNPDLCFRGSGSLAYGKWKVSRSKTNTFIAALEALHGATLAVYTPRPGGGLWNRTVVETYGGVDLNKSSPAYGQGPSHEIKAYDFDCDGQDELVVSLKGGPPYQGVVYYKAKLDADGNVLEWQRAQLHTTSSAFAQVADYDGDGAPDFVFTSYYTPGYFLAQDPKTVVMYNRMQSKCIRSPTSKEALVTPQDTDPSNYDQGVKIRFADPTMYDLSATPEWEIAGWTFRFVSLAPLATWKLPQTQPGGRQFVKVITGSLLNFRAGEPETFPVGAPRKMRSNAVEAGMTEIKAGKNGAVVAFYDVSEYAITHKIRSMSQGPIQRIRGPYNELIYWRMFGEEVAKFSGVDFWNLKGFYLVTHDDKRIAYSQWWTSGNSVDCGYHNHQEWNYTSTFGEIHMCTHVGSGSGGFQYKMGSVPTEPMDKAGENEILIPYLTGYEHGPLWYVDPYDGRPMRNTNSQILYPWHRSISGGKADDPDYAYDVWVVYEINAANWDAVNVPVNLLPQYIANATL